MRNECSSTLPANNKSVVLEVFAQLTNYRYEDPG